MSKNPNPTRTEVKISVGPRRITMARTQRFTYRASKGIDPAAFSDPQRGFALCCDLVVALDTNPKPSYTGEDVAIAFEGNEEELVAKVMEALGVDTEGKPLTEETPEKKD